jgi:hypothetical protein
MEYFKLNIECFDYLDLIIYNAPNCQFCFNKKCDVLRYPEFRKYCYDCAPIDEDILVFFLGTQTKKKRIVTSTKNITNLQNSIFGFLLGTNFGFKNESYFDVPKDFKYLDQIERILQGQKILVDTMNEELELELDFLECEKNIEFLYTSENLCECGNRKLKKFYDCKECRAKEVASQAPLCCLCSEKHVGWDKGRKCYFKSCFLCSNKRVCVMCKRNKQEWDSKNKRYFDLCKFCIGLEERKNMVVVETKKICLKCSSAWGQTVKHLVGKCIV